jgi:hypothetical protein
MQLFDQRDQLVELLPLYNFDEAFFVRVWQFGARVCGLIDLALLEMLSHFLKTYQELENADEKSFSLLNSLLTENSGYFDLEEP